VSKKDVTRFNIICGNAPSMGSDFEYWRQIRNQAERIYEEAKELLEAAKSEDMTQVLDGWADVMYTNEYMDDLLKAGEVNTKAAWEAVCATIKNSPQAILTHLRVKNIWKSKGLIALLKRRLLKVRFITLFAAL